MDGFAKLQPNSSAVIPIGKSLPKIAVLFLLILLFLLCAFGFIISFWGSVVWQTLFSAFFAFPAIVLGLQLVLVVKCKHPPLILEPEGLRMNFTGDFIRYDQIIDVTFSYYSFAMMILRLAPGVKLRSRLAAYAMGRRPLFTALYTMSVSDLAAEIERRMKIAASKPFSSGAPDLIRN